MGVPYLREKKKRVQAGLECWSCSSPPANGLKSCAECAARTNGRYVKGTGRKERIPRPGNRGPHKLTNKTLLAAGRCEECGLLNPCGGHKTIYDYANERLSI